MSIAAAIFVKMTVTEVPAFKDVAHYGNEDFKYDRTKQMAMKYLEEDDG